MTPTTATPPAHADGMAYRPDIDGLRAIAVICVVLFHARVPPFTGGYIGVDVFFVISGYLIGGLLHGRLESGRLSFLEFFERRVRRLLPALYVMLAFSLGATLLLLLPGDAMAAARSLIATLVYASNIEFWRSVGYFSGNALSKPLLHTWSLSVEEQFYLTYPFVLWAIHRWQRRWLPLWIVGGLLLSFALSAWRMEQLPASAFFLAPYRAWEFFAGAVVALPLMPRAGARLAALEGLAGLALIGWSALTLDGASYFPASGALAPCIGAVLLIHSGQSGAAPATRLLSMRAPVFIGLVSYSLYLWHWPLLVFAQYFAIQKLTAPQTALVLAASLLAAVLSWRYVERPLRRRGAGGIPLRSMALGVVASAMVLGVACIGVIRAHGLPQRFTPEALALAESYRDSDKRSGQCQMLDAAHIAAGEVCAIGAPGVKPTFLLWGDSFAYALVPGVDAVAARAGRAGYVATRPGCLPLAGMSYPDSPAGSRHCAEFIDASMTLLRAHPEIDTVIVSGRWAIVTEGNRLLQSLLPEAVRAADAQSQEISLEENRRAFDRTLDATVKMLAPRRIVAVVSDFEQPYNIPMAAALTLQWRRSIPLGVTREVHDRRQAYTMQAFGRLAASGVLETLDPMAALCDADYCRALEQGHALYTDDEHLSVYANHYLEPAMSALFPPAVKP